MALRELDERGLQGVRTGSGRRGLYHRRMHIRPVRDDDFDAIAALTNRYIVGATTHFAYEPVTADELRDGWRKHRDRYPFLVAETPEDPAPNSASPQRAPSGASRFAGYAKAGPWRERAAYAWTPEVSIYIEPAAHRRGIGKTLYAALLTDLRTRGFHSAIAGITLPNPASIRLHESLGFTPVGTVRHAGWKLDAWHDVGFWQVML